MEDAVIYVGGKLKVWLLGRWWTVREGSCAYYLAAVVETWRMWRTLRRLP